MPVYRCSKLYTVNSAYREPAYKELPPILGTDFHGSDKCLIRGF